MYTIRSYGTVKNFIDISRHNINDQQEIQRLHSKKASILDLLAFSFLQRGFKLLQNLTEYLLIIVSRHYPLQNFHDLVSSHSS